MARSDFNQDMGQYLRKRKVMGAGNPLAAAKRFFSKTFGFGQKAKQQEELPLDIPQEHVNAVLKGESAPALTPTRSTTTPRKNTMGWFSKKTEDEDYDMMDAGPAQPVLDEDVKEVLKITFKWLKQMDPDVVEDIKASPDFEKYKAVLDKYGLIKK
jgi:hypothetical protein